MNKLIHNNSLSSYIYIYIYILANIITLPGLILSSSTVSTEGDPVVDQINVTVPISCTLSGTGMNSHNATINNGQYNSAIGETTMKVYCNDNEGFAIYTIGYTDNTDGKNVLSNSTLGSTNDIVTGTSTTGATSNWAMKLSTIASPTPTYPLVIESDTGGSFTNFHTVPDEYTIVAKRESSTDIGSNAEGSTLKSTYQAYVSPTQPAGTYIGQVKYVLVHPYNHAVPKKIMAKDFTVTYEGVENRAYFNQEKTELQNIVSYRATCEVETKQMEIVKTSNLSDTGVKNTPYGEEYIKFEKEFSNASKIRVTINYGFTAGTGGVGVVGLDDQEYSVFSEDENLSGITTYIISGQEVAVFLATLTVENLVRGYDYGAYVTIEPLDENDQPVGINELSNCNYETISGTYKVPSFTTASYFGFSNYYYDDNSKVLNSEQDVLERLRLDGYPNNPTIKAQLIMW